jgi:hypothetical protein
MSQRPTTHAQHGLGDDHQYRRRHSGQHGGDDRGVPRAHVQGGQHQQGDHTRQLERHSGDQATGHPVEQPSDVDGQLLGFGPRQQSAEGQCVEKPPLPDPTFLVNQGVLHHRDLPSRAAEGSARRWRTRYALPNRAAPARRHSPRRQRYVRAGPPGWSRWLHSTPISRGASASTHSAREV